MRIRGSDRLPILDSEFPGLDSSNAGSHAGLGVPAANHRRSRRRLRGPGPRPARVRRGRRPRAALGLRGSAPLACGAGAESALSRSSRRSPVVGAVETAPAAPQRARRRRVETRRPVLVDSRLAHERFREGSSRRRRPVRAGPRRHGRALRVRGRRDRGATGASTSSTLTTGSPSPPDWRRSRRRTGPSSRTSTPPSSTARARPARAPRGDHRASRAPGRGPHRRGLAVHGGGAARALRRLRGSHPGRAQRDRRRSLRATRAGARAPPGLPSRPLRRPGDASRRGRSSSCGRRRWSPPSVPTFASSSPGRATGSRKSATRPRSCGSATGSGSRASCRAPRSTASTRARTSS